MNDEDFQEDDARLTYRFLGHKYETEVRLINPQTKEVKQPILVHSEHEFLRVCRKYSGSDFNVYTGINERRAGGTKGDHVNGVNAVVFDLDPIRDKRHPSSEKELALARERAYRVQEWLLRERGLRSLLAESGNGVQVWMKVACDVNDENRRVVERNLKRFYLEVADNFRGAGVAIDNIADLARVIKVIGTKSVKSEPSEERPHRLSRWLDRPEQIPEPDKLWSEWLSTPHEQSIATNSQESQEEGPLPNGKSILKKCRWFKHCQKDSKKLSEPEWYAALTVSCRCEDGVALSHTLSEAYPTYTREETQKKIAHALTAGPRTCNEIRANFPEEHPGSLCATCSHDVTSPIQLGRSHAKKNISGNTSDVDALIATGLYSADSEDEAYDQIKSAIELCAEEHDAETLWIIARACPFVGAASMARYAAQEAVLATGHFVTEDLAKPEVYWYFGPSGVYRPNGREFIKQLVNKNIPDASAELLSTVVLKVQAETRRTVEELRIPKNLICVRNGVLDIDSGALRPHSPDFFFMSRINASYDPSATCPKFELFLADVLRPNDIMAMEEAIGYILERGMPFHVLFILLGEGRNGKTTLLSTLQAFIGQDAFSAKTLHALSNERFAVANLYGKLANLCGEVSDKPLRQTGLLKDLAGGDVVDGDRKFLSSIRFKNEAKLLFAANIMPFTPDITRAWWSRIIIFQFDKIFMRGDPRTDERLLEKLTTDEELSGILNLAVRGRRRLMQNHNFSYTKTPDEVEEIWNLSCNSVYAWKEACCERSIDENVRKRELYENYVGWCAERRVHPLADNKFFSELHKACPWISEKRAAVGNERIQMLYGLSLKADDSKADKEPVKKDGQQTLLENEEKSVSAQNNPDGYLAPHIRQGRQGKNAYLAPAHEEEDDYDD